MPTTTHAKPECRLNQGVLTIRPYGPRVGDREASNLTSFVGSVMRRHGKNVNRLELDLTDVYTMSVTALGMCLEFERLARQWKATLVLNDVSEPVCEVLRLLRLDRLLDESPRPRPWILRRLRAA